MRAILTQSLRLNLQKVLNYRGGAGANAARRADGLVVEFGWFRRFERWGFARPRATSEGGSLRESGDYDFTICEHAAKRR